MYGKGKVELLADKTLKNYNIDVKLLNTGSHTKICVKCTRCSEEFTREYRYIGQLHNCPTRTVREDGEELKWCNKCKQFLTLMSFNANAARYDGLSSNCISCMRTTPSTIRHNINKAVQRKTTLDGWLKWSISNKKANCKRHGIQFDLDFEYLKQRWDAQQGKCTYFNIPLTYGSKNALNSATLERIDGKLGYIKGNVTFASRMANFAKNDANLDDFNSILSSVVTQLASDIPRVEVVIKHPEAIIPHRQRASDAGYDIHSLTDINISPGDVVDVNTGMAVIAPIGYYFTVEGRSSMYRAGVVPFRGIIDSGYSGDMIVSLMNVGKTTYNIKKGDRIAQIIPHKLITVDFAQVARVSTDYDIRGAMGFGSSGR